MVYYKRYTVPWMGTFYRTAWVATSRQRYTNTKRCLPSTPKKTVCGLSALPSKGTFSEYVKNKISAFSSWQNPKTTMSNRFGHKYVHFLVKSYINEGSERCWAQSEITSPTGRVDCGQEDGPSVKKDCNLTQVCMFPPSHLFAANPPTIMLYAICDT